jgi:hypothetical protein
MVSKRFFDIAGILSAPFFRQEKCAAARKLFEARHVGNTDSRKPEQDARDKIPDAPARSKDSRDSSGESLDSSRDSRDSSRESLNASGESLEFFGESPIHLRDSLVVFGESIFAMRESLRLLFTIFEQEHAEGANRRDFQADHWHPIWKCDT